MTIIPPDSWPVDTITTYPIGPSARGDGTLSRALGPRTAGQQWLFDEQACREQQQIERAAIAYVNARRTIAEMTPREQAEAAWSPSSTRSVDELEDLIRAQRGLPPLTRETGSVS